jgi:membrane fusion protein (multidrug efflux system)
MRVRTRAAVFTTVAACGVLLSGCGREAPKPPEKGPASVMVLTVERKDVPVTPIYVAQTQSSQAVNVQARVSGFLDKRMYVEGSVVKAGQVLFQMDQKPFQAQVDAQAAALQRSQAAMEVAKSNLARTKPLTAQNALSQKDLDDATGQYEQAAAAVEQGKAQLQEAQLNLGYTTITSPVDGVSSFAVVADGTYLNPQNAQLTTVSVLSPLWVNFSVSENSMERVRGEVRNGTLRLPEGGLFTVEIEMVDGSIFPFTGRITFADPSYNPTTGTFLLRATVNNPNGVLRPNQYVRVRLNGAIHPNAIMIPQRAVQQSAKGHFVWVIGKEDQAEMRPVTVGDWQGEGWLITEGLEAGERVVVDGTLRLTQGAKVKPAAWTPPPAPPPRIYGGATSGKAGAAFTGVYFPRGQATLDANARNAIRTSAAAHMGMATLVSVTGYADRTGDYAANVELAKKRAVAVRDELVSLGVNAQRIKLLAPANVTGSGSDDQARRVDIAPAS